MQKQGLRKDVESGVDLGVPDGILINGLGPYRYDQTLVKDGIVYQIINVEPGTQLKVCVQCLVCCSFGSWNIILLGGINLY